MAGKDPVQGGLVLCYRGTDDALPLKLFIRLSGYAVQLSGFQVSVVYVFDILGRVSFRLCPLVYIRPVPFLSPSVMVPYMGRLHGEQFRAFQGLEKPCLRYGANFIIRNWLRAAHVVQSRLCIHRDQRYALAP